MAKRPKIELRNIFTYKYKFNIDMIYFPLFNLQVASLNYSCTQ